MNFSRRRFVRLGVGAALSLRVNPMLGQGVSPHTAKPLPRSAASGRPFNAQFVDVAATAGLHAPVIYGGADSKTYIVASVEWGYIEANPVRMTRLPRRRRTYTKA